MHLKILPLLMFMVKSTTRASLKYPNLPFDLYEARLSDGSKDTFYESFGKCLKRMLDKGPSREAFISILIEMSIDDRQAFQNIGPFMVRMPTGLSDEDVYNFAYWTLMYEGKLHVQSIDRVISIGAKLVSLEKINPLHYIGFLKIPFKKIESSRKLCIYDYIWKIVCGKRGFLHYLKRSLVQEIKEFVPQGCTPNTEELIHWLEECHKNFRLHAFDLLYPNLLYWSGYMSDIVWLSDMSKCNIIY